MEGFTRTYSPGPWCEWWPEPVAYHILNGVIWILWFYLVYHCVLLETCIVPQKKVIFIFKWYSREILECLPFICKLSKFILKIWRKQFEKHLETVLHVVEIPYSTDKGQMSCSLLALSYLEDSYFYWGWWPQVPVWVSLVRSNVQEVCKSEEERLLLSCRWDPRATRNKDDAKGSCPSWSQLTEEEYLLGFF